MSDAHIDREAENAWLKELLKQRNRTIAELIKENDELRIQNDILTTADIRERLQKLIQFLTGGVLTERELEEIRLATEYQAAGLAGGEGRQAYVLRIGVPDRTLRHYVAKWQKSASKSNE